MMINLNYCCPIKLKNNKNEWLDRPRFNKSCEMGSYILFWNPAFSSYTMDRFLDDFNEGGCVGNWSFYEHEAIEEDDEFFMLRCGEGRTGVVMHGTITSESYEDEDWSPKRRRHIFYADIEDDVTINPETASVMLTPNVLTEKLPDFNWYG